MITPDSNSPINEGTFYDFIFIGLGASNSLIILSLLKNGSIAGKKVAILEQSGKNSNDKTYCFWARPNESIVSDLNPIISYRYTNIKVNQNVIQNIEEQPYHYIRSLDLYKHTAEALDQAQIPVYRYAVDKVTNENDLYTVHTSNAKYQTRHIFDSRPPSPDLLSKDDIYLHQSFHGLHIRCKKDVFQKHSFEMMNFNIDQSDYTQFIYVLPFSSGEALVELTRFGADKIDLSYARNVLDEFILKNFGEFEILADESGCIPMTTFINPPNGYSGILNTGASANLIKPSTGYGFKSMYANSKIIADKLMRGDYRHFNRISFQSAKRFRIYDRLLLTILLLWPHQGKGIFTSLFKRQSIATVFSFLDEKTSLYQEVKIFALLPIIPFIKALYLFIKKENWIRYVVAFFAVLSYLIIASFDSVTAMYTSYFILIAGFLAVGIPHGALDHILEKNDKEPLYLFIFKYLAIIGFYFALWHYFPLLSLITFIIFSSFHFGESELEETGVKISSTGSYLKAFTLGLSILLFIIFSHFEESMDVIASMNAFQLQDYKAGDVSLYSLGIAAISLFYIISKSILSKRYSYLGLLFLLLIGIKLPLIFAFGLYFIFQHSYNAWGHLQTGLKLNENSLYKKALPYTLGALIILIAIVIFNPNTIINTEGFLANVFIFLACISLPHFVLMHLFYKSNAH